MAEPAPDEVMGPSPRPFSRGRLLAISAGLALVLVVATLGGVSLLRRAVAPEGLVFVIPAGAAAGVERPGIDSAIEIPTDIRFGPGDVARITVRNDDDVLHRAGPWWLGPGQTYTTSFDAPGSYEFVCTVDAADTVVVTVTE